jgi:hypothetical protein
MDTTEASSASELRAIQGFPGYSVTDDGKVWSSKRHRWMKTRPNHYGHRMVMLSLCGNYRPYRVHRLVLFAFRGQPEPGQVARHLNGNPADNRVENLVWGTQQENIDDKFRHGTICHGDRHYNAKLTDAQVEEIRRLHAVGHTQTAIASIYGVSQSNVSSIVLRKTRKGCS